MGDQGSHPGHGLDALRVGVWSGKGVHEERPLWTFGEGGNPVGTSLPWCHGAFIRTYGLRGRSFGPSEQSCGALRIVERSNGLVGRCPFPASRKPNPDIPSSQSCMVLAMMGMRNGRPSKVLPGTGTRHWEARWSQQFLEVQHPREHREGGRNANEENKRTKWLGQLEGGRATEAPRVPVGVSEP
ncbi:hypothetical protein FB451DRAFT_1195731 [Mycena latifolia]|nr:hypothetical protein FB451DRAFT_1195731 [Mycena latifolia]